MSELKLPADTQEHVDRHLRLRQRGRTDLLYLCNILLGYKDVSWKVHKEILNHLQAFQGGVDNINDKGMVDYVPTVSLWEMTGSRKKLILFPRGHLKSSIITIAHTIQWILNYPDIRILISTATGDQVKKFMTEIKAHFQYNNNFRKIYPDYCPAAKKAADWGSQEEFTVPNRKLHRKEPTVSSCSVGRVIAGAHYEVIKNSDLVDKENVKTPGGIADVISHFSYLNPLLERSEIAPHHGWIDVEGTRYDFGDLYGKLIDSGDYECMVRPLDDQETCWPARFPPEELKRIEKEVGAYIFSCQMRNKPIPPEGGLCDSKDMVFVPREILGQIKPMLRLHCTIDLHGMEPAKNNNDFTVLTVGGFDRDGRLYIIDIRRGRFTPEQVINHIFEIHDRYPRIFDFKIEKDAHARVLLPFIQREAAKRQKFPIMVPIPRDNHTSKQQRIKSLQPWFKTQNIRFADDLPCKTDLMLEVMQFPSQSSGCHDDILDTLADLMQSQEQGVVTPDVYPDAPDYTHSQFGVPRPRDGFIGFEDGTGREVWRSGIYGPEPQDKERSITGVL